jgi:hypothetical protein
MWLHKIESGTKAYIIINELFRCLVGGSQQKVLGTTTYTRFPIPNEVNGASISHERQEALCDNYEMKKDNNSHGKRDVGRRFM